MLIGVLVIDAYVTMYHNYSREAIGDVIHVHLEYVQGYFEANWHVKQVIASLVCIKCFEM